MPIKLIFQSSIQIGVQLSNNDTQSPVKGFGQLCPISTPTGIPSFLIHMYLVLMTYKPVLKITSNFCQ